MQNTFWQQLAKPVVALSPMDGVTDHPFRHIQKKYGHPELVYTEFTSVEGVCHGAERLLKDFLFDESQRPIIAQIYGTTPEFFQETATLLCELGFDGIDINMGCPAKNVAHLGAGAALIKTPALAQQIVRATKQGVQDYQAGKQTRDCEHISENVWQEVERRHALLPSTYQSRERVVPVSIKTRVGFDSKIATDWISTLLETEPVAIGIHGRTLKQAYGGLADWEEIGRAVAVAAGSGVLILGNGDVHSYEEALQKVAQYGVDGVLIGRAAFGNPSAFLKPGEELAQDIFTIALEHCRLYEQVFDQDVRYNFLPMRKHLGWYVKEIENARQIRIELFKTNHSREVAAVLHAHGLI